MDVKQQIAVEVFQLARRWRVLLDAALKPVGLTKAGWAVMYWLAQDRQGLTQKALAERVAIETSTLTRQLDIMQAQGLVERTSVRGDRRVRQVRLTAAAQAKFDEITLVPKAIREELFEGVSEADLRTTVEVLRKAHRRLMA